jgi:molybdate transport system regulatory protein
MKTKSTRAITIQPRIRVWVGDDVALGPGKVELLELLHVTGSITAAARQMGMSYMRAWTLIQTMNRCFSEPLVLPTRGGKKGGSTALTETGLKALECYQEMEKSGLKAMARHWRRLRSLVRN